MNGWTNRETWLVNLWFGDYFNQEASEGREITPDEIKDFVESHLEEVSGGIQCGFTRDLLNSFEINYHELAKWYNDNNDDVIAGQSE